MNVDSLDTTVLRLLRKRDTWERLSKAVPVSALDPMVQVLFGDMAAFFAANPDAVAIDAPPFRTWLFGFKRTGLKEDAKVILGRLIDNAFTGEVPRDGEAGIMERLVACELASQLTRQLERFQAGEEVDLRAVIQEQADRYDRIMQRRIKDPWDKSDIGDILSASENHAGLTWPWESINQRQKPASPGDFHVIAARPDTGKTSLIAQIVSCWAPQVSTLYGDRPVIWLNNEGASRQIILRIHQAALGSTEDELILMHKDGSLKDRYIKAIGGKIDRIKVMSIHDWSSHDVDELLRRENPAVVVFDMIDNVRFSGDINHGGQRTDQVLESMYQWARYLGVKYDAVMLATSQISSEGAGMLVPQMHMLKDSKTGKQGASDVQWMLGHSFDPTIDALRTLSTPKNKRLRSGFKKSATTDLIFQADRSVFMETR